MGETEHDDDMETKRNRHGLGFYFGVHTACGRVSFSRPHVYVDELYIDQRSESKTKESTTGEISISACVHPNRDRC